MVFAGSTLCTSPASPAWSRCLADLDYVDQGVRVSAPPVAVNHTLLTPAVECSDVDADFLRGLADRHQFGHVPKSRHHRGIG